MKKLDKRVEKNTQSIFALRDMLKNVISAPNRFKADEILLKALKSQGGLAKYVNPEQKIYSSSLNTVKRIAEQCLSHGFKELDKLRVTALEAIETNIQKEERGNKITRAGLIKRVSELEAEVQLLKGELLLLTALLERSMKQSRRYAYADRSQNIQLLCKKEQQELRAAFALRKYPEIINAEVK